MEKQQRKQREQREIKTEVEYHITRGLYKQQLDRSTISLLRKIEYDNLLLEEETALKLIHHYLKYCTLRDKMLKLDFESILFYCYYSLKKIEGQEIKKYIETPVQEERIVELDDNYEFDDYDDITIEHRRRFNSKYEREVVSIPYVKRVESGTVYDKLIEDIDEMDIRIETLRDRYPDLTKRNQTRTKIPKMGIKYSLDIERETFRVLCSRVIIHNTDIRKLQKLTGLTRAKIKEIIK